MIDNTGVNKAFDNRIEIVSLGHLPNSLTVEKIRHGNSIIRNPILVSYASKNIPTAKYQSVMYKEEQSPIRVAYRRLVWYDFGIQRPKTDHHGF